jgi:hypothetical protein
MTASVSDSVTRNGRGVKSLTNKVRLKERDRKGSQVVVYGISSERR